MQKKTGNLKINLFKQSYITNIALWLASNALAAPDSTVRHRVQIFNEKNPIQHPSKTVFHALASSVSIQCD